MNNRFSVILISSLISLFNTGCPDPQNKFDNFTERRQTYLDEVNQMDAGGSQGGDMMEMNQGGSSMGGEEMGGSIGGSIGGSMGGNIGGSIGGIMGGNIGGNMGGDMGGSMGGEIITPSLPAIGSGLFYLAFAPVLDPTKPMVFLGQLDISIAEDGQSGTISRMILDPLTCEDRQVSAEGDVIFDGGAPIDSDGNFSIDFGEQNVPGIANCISGSLIQATIQLQGQILNENEMCGAVVGQLMQPFEYDLAGSTFAAYRVEEGVDLNTLEIKGSCEEL